MVLEYDGPNGIQETAAATGAIQFSTMHAPAIDATSDLSEGLTHSVDDYPIVLAGRAGGAMRFPGIHLRGPSLVRKNTADVLMTILQPWAPPGPASAPG